MEQNTFTLLITILLAVIATIFTIIGVSTPGWPGLPGKVQLFGCGPNCNDNYTAAGVLLIISIVFLAIVILFTLMFWRGLISNASDKVKSIVLAFLILAVILIMIAYAQVVSTTFYSYHLTVTAGILAFLSAIFFTYWLGRTSVTFFS